MVDPDLIPHISPGAQVEQLPNGYRLSIPSGKADAYRLAQVSDYDKKRRREFPHRFPLNLNLSARVSSNSLPGTWGFGLWNDPFGMSIGHGGEPFRIPALPNAAWFFGASRENHLSFSDKPANGFLAQVFMSPRFHSLMVPAGIAFPFSRKATRRFMSQVVDEDGITLSVDVTQWHRYRFEWGEKRVRFKVDDIFVFESVLSPNPPLGLVLWIDNQYAAFTPEGKIGFGVLENAEPAWLEVMDLRLG